MSFLLEVVDYKAPITDITDKLAFGGKMLLQGMMTVFAVLLTLWFTLFIFKIFFHDIPSKSKKKVKAVKEDASPVTSSSGVSDEELIAVFAAAIAMAESESAPDTKFRVVSFKRK